MKLIAVVVLLTFIGGIVGLECYTCVAGSGNSVDTNACYDPFNKSTSDPYVLKIDCTAQSLGDVCSKAERSDGMMARTCWDSNECLVQGGCASGSYGGLSATVCCCSGNLCNGAGSVTVNIATTAITMAAIFTL